MVRGSGATYLMQLHIVQFSAQKDSQQLIANRCVQTNFTKQINRMRIGDGGQSMPLEGSGAVTRPLSTVQVRLSLANSGSHSFPANRYSCPGCKVSRSAHRDLYPPRIHRRTGICPVTGRQPGREHRGRSARADRCRHYFCAGGRTRLQCVLRIRGIAMKPLFRPRMLLNRFLFVPDECDRAVDHVPALIGPNTRKAGHDRGYPVAVDLIEKLSQPGGSRCRYLHQHVTHVMPG